MVLQSPDSHPNIEIQGFGFLENVPVGERLPKLHKITGLFKLP